MQPTSLSRQKIRALIAEGECALAEGPHPERARFDAEAIILHLFRRDNPQRNLAWLIAHWNNPTGHGTEFRTLIERRRTGEPIQYILGEAEFYGLPFRVTPDVLIPRPETEHLVEKVIEVAAQFVPSGAKAPSDFVAPAGPLKSCLETAVSDSPASMGLRIVDVGTGSGAIAVALAHKLPQAAVTGIDLSGAALAVARENARRNGVSIRFLEGDLLAPVAGEQFDLVVSNPPYVPQGDRETLSVEVRDHEPALALFAGGDGLEVYRRLIPDASAVLVAGGLLALEIGYGQSAGIAGLLARSGFEKIEFVPDLQGIPRVACAQKPPAH
jgi:release factor glutamine methyltransferase